MKRMLRRPSLPICAIAAAIVGCLVPVSAAADDSALTSALAPESEVQSTLLIDTGGICGSATGDCCVALGSPGCGDADCCLAVCTADPFCCDVEWDGVCADEAADLCGALCEVPSCDLTCSGAAEGETCGADTNGGCNTAGTPVFTEASCGSTWCGTTFADGNMRDTDWYRLDHPGGMISASVTSELPVTLFVLEGIDTCTPALVGEIGCSDECAPLNQASAVLPAGQYVVFVAPGDCLGAGVFNDHPCGGNNEYQLEIDCGNVALAAMDVLPEDCPNDFNPGAKGVTPIALIGDIDFDVLDVDITTLALRRSDGVGGTVAPLVGPPGPSPKFMDETAPSGETPCNCTVSEADGIDDLVLKFSTQELSIAFDLGSALPGDQISLDLTGELLDGSEFAAVDCIRLVSLDDDELPD